jgi:hypothetical protein
MYNIAKCVHEKIHSVRLIRYTHKTFFISNVKIHINHTSKLSDKATVEFIKSTEWASNSLDFNPLASHVGGEFTRLVYKNQ